MQKALDSAEGVMPSPGVACAGNSENLYKLLNKLLKSLLLQYLSTYPAEQFSNLLAFWAQGIRPGISLHCYTTRLWLCA